MGEPIVDTIEDEPGGRTGANKERAPLPSVQNLNIRAGREKEETGIYLYSSAQRIK